MNLEEAIYHRRSVRQYTDQPVTREEMEKLLDAAVQAPSATNSQPWAFAVIQNQALLAEYSKASKEMLLPFAVPGNPLHAYHAMLSDPNFNIFYNAKTLLLICSKPGFLHGVGDCCLAAQNVMLTAHAMGLGSCWIGFAQKYMDQPEIKAKHNIPSEYTLAAPLILGYPAVPLVRIPKRPPEILSWQS